MKTTILRLVAAATALGLAGTGLAYASGWRPGSSSHCTPDVAPVELDGFPYHPLVYHLDLSILAYQLHGQSLIWPYDPYYEERASVFGSARDDFMDEVRAWAVEEGAAQVAYPEGLGDYRGPGALAGFPDNPNHDPVIYDYSRIHPWASTIINGDGRWTEYLTPTEITSTIAEASVAYRPIGGDDQTVVIDPIDPARAAGDPGADDILIAFEGGTGDKGEADQPNAQSLMGFVLARSRPDGAGYDVHVSFRGSRSGSAHRAFFEAMSTGNATGNPDWITDLGFRLVDADDGAGHISTEGEVARGFATSIGATLPTVFASLEAIAQAKGDVPLNVYVTGHSLGGALAQHFTSAVLMGDLYGPGGAGPAMPASLERWPWEEIKLITFGAPRAGNEEWARPFTVDRLQAQFYDDGILPFDRQALDTAAEEIAPRLTDETRPAGYRVLISTDPITTDVFDDGRSVGTTVYVNLVCGNDPFGLPDTGAHEPVAIRDMMLLAINDDRTPPVAWRYLPLDDLGPRDDSKAGTPAEFERLRDSVIGYYEALGVWFDVDAFNEDFDLLMGLGEAQR